MRSEGRIWYVTVLAFIFLIFCAIGIVHYVSMNLKPGVTVPIEVQLLCLGMGVAAGLYFFHARLGHKTMIASTILILLAIGTTDAKASGFYFCVLLILLIPFVTYKGKWRYLKNNNGG